MGRIVIWTTAVALLSLASARSAFADDADQSFDAGRALLKGKRYAEACPKFEESQRQDPASGTLLALAYCQELSGLLATAWTSYAAAAALAEREGHSDRRSAAAERAHALAERLSKLTVVVPQELLELPGFHLLRDGIEFERASFGIQVPLDGGTHTFQATAPGRTPWSSTVTLLPERDQKTLVLPVLDLAQPLATAPPELLTARPLLAVGDRAREGGSGMAIKRVSLAFVAGSVVGLGIGTGFALSARSKNEASKADGHCDSTGCDKQGMDLRNDALSAARVSTWSFVAAGALAASGITLYFVARPNSSSSSRSAKVQANVSIGAPSLSLVGNF